MNISVTTIIGLLAIGLIAGLLSSTVGIGGGVVIVPGLVLVLAMSQKMAQGTSLALMLPPIGIMAVVQYYKAGYVDFKVAGIICITFLVGSYLGSKIVVSLPESVIKKIFGIFLLVIAVKYIFFDKK